MERNVVETLVTVAALILSVVVHECAHGYVAMLRGDPTAKEAGRLTLNPIRHVDLWGSILVPVVLALSGGVIFGWAKPVPVDHRRLNDPRWDSLWVSLAGPISNFLLALVAAVLIGIVAGVAVSGGQTGLPNGLGVRFLESLLLVNLILGLFNLLPLPPLDGSWVMSALLPLPQRITYERLRPYGMILLLVLLFTGGFRFLWGGVAWMLQGYSWLAGSIAASF